MKSFFTDKEAQPTAVQLQNALGSTFPIWEEFAAHTQKLNPAAVAEWHFASEKYGWSFRIKVKKRILIYLLPRDKFFKVAFVFGQKATNAIVAEELNESIKKELLAAKVYAEGRGIRLAIIDSTFKADVIKLIAIKFTF